MLKTADEVRTPLSGRFYGAPDTIKDEGSLRPGEPIGTAGGLHRARHPKGLVGLFVSVSSMGAPLGGVDKSCGKLVTVSQVKRNSVRATEHGTEA